MLERKNCTTVRDSLDKSESKCHGCGGLGHWVRDCPKGYNKDWLTTQQRFKCRQLGHFRRDCPFKTSSTKTKPISDCGTVTKPNESKPGMPYHPTTTLPKMIGMLDSFELHKRPNYVPLEADNSVPQKTKQQSDEWFKFRKGKINGSKASVCLGWRGKPIMESYWSSFKQGKEARNNSEISNKDQLSMK